MTGDINKSVNAENTRTGFVVTVASVTLPEQKDAGIYAIETMKKMANFVVDLLPSKL